MFIFLQILLSSRLMEFLKIFTAFSIGSVNQLMLRISLEIFLSTCHKKIYQKLNYWQRDKTITNCGVTTGKELLQPQKLILFWPKWTRFWDPQVAVLICSYYVKTYQEFFILTSYLLPWNMVEPWKWKPQTNFLS